MRIFSEKTEKLLSYVGSTIEKDPLTWTSVRETLRKGKAELVLPTDILYRRGWDIELFARATTDDRDEVWELAAPYYYAAHRKGLVQATYRLAHCGEGSLSQIIHYGEYLEKAARRGYVPAIREYYENYNDFKADTVTACISKNSWKVKKRQEKTFFRCCRYLAGSKDPEVMMKLGNCYIHGTGVKVNLAKGLELRDYALDKIDMDEADLFVQRWFQKYYREESSKPRFPLLHLVKETLLFPIRRNRRVPA